jgi:arginase family enzyme
VALPVGKTVEVIGAPMQWGQPHLGTDDTPQRLRSAGLREVVAKLGWRLADAGDVDMSFKDLARG